MSGNKVLPVKGTMQHWLLLSCFLSCVLLVARMIVTGSLAYLCLPWNLFLAFVPYLITLRLEKHADRHPVILFFILACWLLFIPNSFYIITDLFHLTEITSAPQWFDLLLVFSFAWNGIVFGILSVRRVEQLVARIYGRRFSAGLIIVVMWLNALGIYIGRYLRYNSWDIITDPFSLISGITDLVVNPFANAVAWGMTLCYALFMTILYFTVRALGSSLGNDFSR